MPATALAGAYRPRRPTKSPLNRLPKDQLDRFRGPLEDAFEHRWGRWRAVVDEVVERFLERGVLESGFARDRCGECWAEHLVPCR